MTVDKQQIDVFFFGSPGEGFTAYPSQFSNKVNGLDKSNSSHKLECKYIVKDNKTKIQYAEYGLTGVGQHGKSRGGRNFGIWIEIKGKKLDEDGTEKVLNYIKTFINEGILLKTNLFDKDSSSNIKHYVITSFNEVSDTLDKWIEVFKEHFIADFKDNFQSITINDSYTIDLNPEKVKSTKKDANINTSIKHNKDVVGVEIDYSTNSIPKTQKKFFSFSFEKLNTLLLTLLLLITLFGSSYKSNPTTSIENSNNKTPTNTHKTKTISDKNENNYISQQKYIIKAGDNLNSIVKLHKKSDGSFYTVEEIMKHNDIKKPTGIQPGQIIMFPNE